MFRDALREKFHNYGSSARPAIFRNSLPMNSPFLRRLGPDPHANGAQTAALLNCPDIWELADGDFAVIGINITELAGQLPPSASCGPDERIVRVPRRILVGAKRDIPDRV